LHRRVQVEDDRLSRLWLTRARCFGKARVQKPVGGFESRKHARPRGFRRDQLRQVFELAQEYLATPQSQAGQLILTAGQGGCRPIPQSRQLVADRSQPELHPTRRSFGLQID
jgi:hypothetical protein